MNTISNPDSYLSQSPIDPSQVLSPWIDFKDSVMACSKKIGANGYIVAKICQSSMTDDGEKRITICGTVSKMRGTMEKVRAHVDKTLREKGYSFLYEKLYVFHRRQDIEGLIDNNIRNNPAMLVQITDGATRTIFINAILLNQFIKDNYPNDRAVVHEERLMEIAEICGQYYRIPPKYLVDAWMKVIGKKYYNL